ncbi:MAG: transcription elongation factor GreA [Oscillospiraceae bacterium]|nr:transcription elongation factor GreA [Oscillospiraceae bacterium]
MQKVYKLSKARFDELSAELEHMKTVRKKEVADQIEEARSFGDLSENSEYDEAMNEQGRLYSRIAEVENILANCEIIEGGTRYVVLDLDDNTEEEYHLVGSQEADPYQQRISDESPLGKALQGAKAGDVVSVNAPGGEIKYKVLKVN